MMQTDSEVYRRLEPLIQRQIDRAVSASASGSSTLSPPSTLGALLADGSVPLTGNLTVSAGKTIDGYDIDVTFSAMSTQIASLNTYLTPATLSVSSANLQSGSGHTHAITSSSYPGAAAALLATNASGWLGVQALGVGIAAQSGYAIYSSVASPSYLANSLRLGTTAAGDLAARLHVLATGTQVQLSYDAFDYAFLAVSSSGALSIANTGSSNSAAHIYLNPGAGEANVGIGNAIPTPTAKLEVNATWEQLRLNYLSTLYASLEVTSFGNLNINALNSGTYMNLHTQSHIGHPSYASQTAKWRISNAGEADFRYLYVDELHAKAFIADLEQALAGGQIIGKSVAKVYAAFSVPTAGNTGNLDVEEFAGFAGFHVFVDGDLVRLRQFDRSGGGLKIADIWGTVTYSAQVAGSNPPAQRYVFTRHATYPGTGSGTISAGTLVLDYGTTGNGYYEVNAIDGAAGINSPYSQIVTWATHPKSTTAGQGLQVRMRLGQLRGLTGVSQFGLYAGTGWTANPNESNVSQYSVTTPTVNDQHRYILAGDNGVNIINADLQIYSGTTPVITLSRTGPSIAVGSASDTMGYLTGPAGFWVGNNSGTYTMRLGSVSGGALTQGLTWDGSRLNIVGSASIGPSASANYGVNIGNPVIMLRFDGDDSGHRGQRNQGTLDYGPGKFGRRSLLSRRAATNLISAVSDATFSTFTGWFLAQDGTSTAAVSSLDAAHGSSSVRLVRNGGTYHYINTNYVTVSASSNYSASVWCKQTNGTGYATLKILQYNSSNVYLGAATDVTVNFTAGLHDWEYKKITFATNAAAAKVLIVLDNSNTGGSAITWWDAASLVASSVMPGFGESSAAATSATYTSEGLDPESCTVSFWANPASNQVAGGGYLFTTYTTWTSNSIYINSNTSGQIVCAMNNAGATSATALTIGTWSLVTCTISAATIKVYINGVLAASGAHGGICTPGATMRVGGWSGGDGYEFDGQIDDFFILDRVLSDNEILALYNSNAPASIESSPYSLYLYGEDNQGYVRGSAAGLFGYSAQSSAAGTGAFALVATNSTALGTPFGSVTLDAGDVIFGSASSGKSNLYWDQSAGSLSFRIATTTRLNLDTSGNLLFGNSSGNNVYYDGVTGELSIRNSTTKRLSITSGGIFSIFESSGANSVLQLDGSGNASITGTLSISAPGKINVGSSDVIIDSGGIAFKAVTAFADIDTLRWTYSGNLTGYVYSIVDTVNLNVVTNVRAWATPSSSYTSYVSLGALNNAGTVNATFRVHSYGTGEAHLAFNNLGTYALYANVNVFSIFAYNPSHGNGAGVIFIANASSVPSTNPTGGGVLYASGGTLYWRTSSGNLRTIASV